MSKIKKVLFCMPNFYSIGAQRVVINLLNHWDFIECPVALLVHNETGDFRKELRQDVPVYVLDEIIPYIKKVSVFLRIIAYYKALKRAQPDVVISVTQYDSLVLCVLKNFFKFKLIVAEHITPSDIIKNPGEMDRAFKFFYKNFFPMLYNRKADLVQVVSDAIKRDLVDNFSIQEKKICRIYNPLDIDKITHFASVENVHPWLQGGYFTYVSASRLSPQKRLDILLKAFALTKENLGEDAKIRLIICGEGACRQELLALSQQLHLQEYVNFVGFTNNPWSYIARANVFVSTSEYEGLPLGLCEAVVLGAVCIASAQAVPHREVLRDGSVGYLFEPFNHFACAEQMIHVFSHYNSEEIALKRKNAEYIRLEFSVQNICKKYCDMFNFLYLS